MDVDITSELFVFTNSVVLDASQRDRLIEVFLAASTEERPVIARMYRDTFMDANFLQLLKRRAKILLQEQAERMVRAEEEAAAAAAAAKANNNNSKAKNQHRTAKRRGRKEGQDEDDGENDGGEEGNPAHCGDEIDTEQVTAALKEQCQAVASRCRAIRKQIDEVVCKVIGPGPHRLRFGVVKTKADCAKIIDIYKEQFIYPGESELKKRHVLPPAKTSNSRSAPRVGNFHWFIVHEQTGEIACAASVNLHAVVPGRDEKIVFEIPLFATAAGFKHLGLARLLNAAIQELAVHMKAEMIIVSADEDAVPFWTSPSLGQPYAALTQQKRPAAYDTMCHHFGDSVCLGWIPPSGAAALNSSILEAALSKTPKFVLNGPARLSMP